MIKKVRQKSKTVVRGSTEAHQVLLREVMLRLNGRCKVWKQQTGATMIGQRFIRFGIKGAADITGILPGGVRLEIEIKTGLARQSPHQKEYQLMIESFGGIYLVARDGEKLVEDLRTICEERGIRF